MAAANEPPSERPYPAWVVQIAGIVLFAGVVATEAVTGYELPPIGWGIIAGLTIPDVVRLAIAARNWRTP